MASNVLRDAARSIDGSDGSGASRGALDGLATDLPRDPYFDAVANAWVLSRYDEVLSAFRDVRLLPGASPDDATRNPRDETGAMISRHEVRDALTGPRLDAWRARMGGMADSALAELPKDASVSVLDLLHEFARPWCLSLGIMATGADAKDRKMLAELGEHVFAATASPRDSELRPRAVSAVGELDRYFAQSPIPLTQQTFIGVSQTVPRLLAAGWLAFFSHPAEVSRLRVDPALAPRAIEELLRYAGLIVRLSRISASEVDVGTLHLVPGDRVILDVASANRDADQYPDPERLDVTRRVSGQLTFGIGRNACIGGRLVRAAYEVGTLALLRKFSSIETVEGKWRLGSGLRFPTEARFAIR